MVEYRICTQCAISHIENCRTCFGFGVYGSKGGTIPASASEAVLGVSSTFFETTPIPVDRQYRPCPECHSTLKGLPNE